MSTLESIARLGGVRIDDLGFLTLGMVFVTCLAPSVWSFVLVAVVYFGYWKGVRDKPRGFVNRYLYYVLNRTQLMGAKPDLPPSFLRRFRN